MLLRSIFGKTLYYPGKSNFKITQNYQKILDLAKVRYVMLDNIPSFNDLYGKDLIEAKRKLIYFLKDNGIKKIITNCPHSYNILKDIIPSEHIITTIFNKIQNIIPDTKLRENLSDKSKQIEDNREIVTYHDSCNLCRKNNICNKPREIIRALGYILEEFEYNKKNALCCGNNVIEFKNKISKKRLMQCKTKILITACPVCYKNFQENSKDIRILELSEAILKNVR